MNVLIESILQCPITGSSLLWLKENEIEQINDHISKRSLYHLNGTLVENSLDAAFVSSDRRFIYPIIDDIIILLPDLAIIANKEEINEYEQTLTFEKKQVMDFYDQIGWRESDNGVYEDALRFGDLRPVASEYVSKCNLRLNEHISDRGTYLLDIASGPIQHSEYLTYSSGYDFRICADISFRALQQAKKKLGDNGIYLLCDVTKLPLRNDSVDGFVSLHTIYHVPADEQLMAIEELCRALKHGRSGVVVYSWGRDSLLNNVIIGPLRTVRRIKAMFRKLLPILIIKKTLNRISKGAGLTSHKAEQQLTDSKEPRLYFHTKNYGWYQQELKHRFNADIACWRSISVPVMKRIIHGRFFGNKLLAYLYQLESIFPQFFGKYGQYPVFIFRKQNPGGGS